MKVMPVNTPATEPRLVSDHHDAVLALALGSLSLVRRFEELVSRATTPEVQPLDRDDTVVLAALGVVSLGRSLRRWLEEAAVPTQPSTPSPSSAHRPERRELLR
jgi:hypothetical protein